MVRGAVRSRLHRTHVHRFIFPLVIVLVVAVVLIQGFYNRAPAPAAPVSDDPIEEPSESPLAPLSIRPDLEKTPLTYVSDYWLQVPSRRGNTWYASRAVALA